MTFAPIVKKSQKKVPVTISKRIAYHKLLLTLREKYLGMLQDRVAQEFADPAEHRKVVLILSLLQNTERERGNGNFGYHICLLKAIEIQIELWIRRSESF